MIKPMGNGITVLQWRWVEDAKQWEYFSIVLNRWVTATEDELAVYLAKMGAIIEEWRKRGFF